MMCPSDFSDEIDSDDSRLAAVPTKDVVHRPLFHRFWSKDHFDKATASYSFAEEDITLAGRRLQYDLEEFVANIALERVPYPRYPGKSSKTIPKPRFVDTMRVLRGRDAILRREIFCERMT